ncbi:SMI1/KNR4 family protein [Ktedonobacter sp. SOSP1-52]|uniref:SMI1/KNR4 family protein n=1 Tax=Ktedonobacter sp. SOSP1-52 TaxID=2778366 RepID=UPI001915A3EF|nr:SMI1/KNR4 family protein [Ktedonobacter sp. SOSP1-52]GHO61741.1 SMI1/KNR4 family protein [Ktedonobacter sp. SOSP1-52]
MDELDPIKVLGLLRSKLSNDSYLEVTGEGAYVWRASFSFFPPATVEDLERLKSYWKLPSSYEQFLLYSNGAELFIDDRYGQWGFSLYAVNDILIKNTHWQSLYDDWSSSFLVFAECLGDADLLILDTNRHSLSLPHECYVLDGDTGYPVKTWQKNIIAKSFVQWLDRLIVAQGSKYWHWISQ